MRGGRGIREGAYKRVISGSPSLGDCRFGVTVGLVIGVLGGGLYVFMRRDVVKLNSAPMLLPYGGTQVDLGPDGSVG